MGALAAELELELLHGAGGVGHDAAPRGRGSGECHHVDQGAGGELVSNVSSTGDHIEHTGGQTGLFCCLRDDKSVQRRPLMRLQYDGAASRES